jgi:hypothetical protein
MSTYTNTLKARVKRGAALLDKQVRGWAERIDIERLDLSASPYYPDTDYPDTEGSYGCGCVLAQLDAHDEDGERVGYYSDGAQALGLDFDHALEYGFTSHEPDKYPKLTELWVAAINERKASAGQGIEFIEFDMPNTQTGA